MDAYIALFGLSLGLAWVLTWLALAVAERTGFLDLPDQNRKRHSQATPLLGGVAVCLALVGALLAGACLGWHTLFSQPDSAGTLGCLVCSMAILCGVGVWDDKHGMRAGRKLLLQFMAVLPYAVWTAPLGSVEVFGWQLQMAWLGLPATIFWLVACTNFVNLVDGLDGLAGTVTLIVTATVGILSYVNCQFDVLVIALCLSGAILGFLWHNWPPARIFLGDSGSLPLGFLAGALAMQASAKKAAGVTLVMPLVLLSVPMFDTTMAILRRKLAGKKIGEGDRAHIHHCLRDRGFSPQQTLLTIGGLCVSMSTAVVLSAVFHNDAIAVITCLAMVGALIAGKVFGFHEAELLGRHVSAAWTLLHALPAGLRSRFILARLGPAATVRWREFWEQLVREVRRRQGTSLEFVCISADEPAERLCLTWSSEQPSQPDSACWELRCRVPRENGMEAVVQARGEAAAARRSPALHDLLDLLTAFGRAAPLDLPADAAFIERPTVISGHWPAAVSAAHRDAA